MPKKFCCESCEISYENDRSLRRHYEQHPEHRKSFGGRTSDAKGATAEFLSVRDINKIARIRKFGNELSDRELLEILQPVIAKRAAVYDLLIVKSHATSNRQHEKY